MFQLRSSVRGTPRDQSVNVSYKPSALEAASASTAAAAAAAARPTAAQAERKTALISNIPVMSAFNLRHSCTSRSATGPECDMTAGNR
jgi:hypothetical protein